MKGFSSKLVILLSILIVFTACNSNNDNYIKGEKNANNADLQKKHDDVVKSNGPVNVDKKGDKESMFVKKDIAFNTANKIEYNRKAISLNDEAMSLIAFSMPPLTYKDSSLLHDALILLDKAIIIDSLYQLAYANKAMVLEYLGRNEDAINALTVIVKLRPDYAEGFTYLGYKYEKLGNMDSANISYRSAISAYSRRIERTNNVLDKLNRAFIISLIDKDKGLQEMEKIVEKNPDDKTFDLWKQQFFYDFDRQKFISNQ